MSRKRWPSTRSAPRATAELWPDLRGSACRAGHGRRPRLRDGSHRAPGQRATRSDGRVDRGRAWQAGRRPRERRRCALTQLLRRKRPQGHDGGVGAESVAVGGDEDRLAPRSASLCMPARSSHHAASPAAIGSSSPTASTRSPSTRRQAADRSTSGTSTVMASAVMAFHPAATSSGAVGRAGRSPVIDTSTVMV